MSVKEQNIFFSSFSEVPDIVSKRIYDTLQEITLESQKPEEGDDAPKEKQDIQQLCLIDGQSLDELFNEDLFLMMLLWSKAKGTPYSTDRIISLLREEKQDAVYFKKTVLPRLVQKGYLEETLIDGEPSYTVRICYQAYARARFSESLRKAGYPSLLSYVASYYNGKMIDDNDLDDLWYWIGAIRGYLVDD